MQAYIDPEYLKKIITRNLDTAEENIRLLRSTTRGVMKTKIEWSAFLSVYRDWHALLTFVKLYETAFGGDDEVKEVKLQLEHVLRRDEDLIVKGLTASLKEEEGS